MAEENQEMTMDKYLESKYLKPMNLKEGTYAIIAAKFEIVGSDGDKCPVLYFDGIEKGHVVNKTNGEFLSKNFGNNLGDYLGKKISLLIMNEKIFGKFTDTIRYAKAQ